MKFDEIGFFYGCAVEPRLVVGFDPATIELGSSQSWIASFVEQHPHFGCAPAPIFDIYRISIYGTLENFASISCLVNLKFSGDFVRFLSSHVESRSP